MDALALGARESMTALLLARTHNDATIIDALADQAVKLAVGTHRVLEPA